MSKIGKTLKDGEIVEVFECEVCHYRFKAFGSPMMLDDMEVCDECYEKELYEAKLEHHEEEAAAGIL